MVYDIDRFHHVIVSPQSFMIQLVVLEFVGIFTCIDAGQTIFD